MEPKKNKMYFGIRAIAEAIESGKSLDKVLLKRGIDKTLSKQLVDIAKRYKVPVQFIPEKAFAKFSSKNHQGAVAFGSPVEYQEIEDIIPFLFEQGKMPFILILDHITDVRNFGAICRSAACAGVDAIVIPDKGSAQINPDAIKTSAGAIFTIPICRVGSLVNTVKYLKNSGVNVISCTEKGDKNVFDTEINLPAALIMGSEDVGISNDLIRHSDVLVKIPLQGPIKSLNVSVAAGICLFAVHQNEAVNA